LDWITAGNQRRPGGIGAPLRKAEMRSDPIAQRDNQGYPLRLSSLTRASLEPHVPEAETRHAVF
jgi:hypothetical protein